MSDANGTWPVWAAVALIVVAAVIIVPTVVNHVVNRANKNKIKDEIKESYTKEEAKEEIDSILKKYNKDEYKSEIEFSDSAVKIKNSMNVDSRYDRQKISMIIVRTENLTERTVGNISSEWLFHNIAYVVPNLRGSAQDADIEYGGDGRNIVKCPTKVLEIFGWE